MADQVKELYKGEILFGNYVSNTQTLYTTDSTKTAVIKDVEVGSTGYITAPSLQVSDFNVVSLTGSAAGSEIVGTNSTVKIKNNDTTAYYIGEISYIANTQTNPTLSYITNPTSVVLKTFQGTLAQSTSTTFSNSLGGWGDIKWAYKINGKLYYYNFDGNSTTGLYSLTTSGTTSTINSASYAPKCFDGVSKFYWVQISSFYVHDALTDTTTYLGPAPENGSTYPAIWYSNGIVFWRPTYSSGNLYAYNVSTNTTHAIGNWTNSQVGQAVAFYDDTTKTHKLYSAASNYTGSWYYIGITQNSPSSFTITTPANSMGITSVRINQYATADTYAFGFLATENSRIYKFDKDLNILGYVTVTGANFTTSTIPTLQITKSVATSEQLNTYGPKINLRITGVESTL